MIRRRALAYALVTCLAPFALPAHAQPVPGKPAPDFTLTDVSGKSIRLADFRGRFVVLEWNNPSCPFVQKHYDSGNMQALQKRFTAKNVAWLTINSTAASHAEFLEPAALGAWMTKQGGSPSAVLLDPKGTVGRSYDARATPHMYVIDPQGRLVYAGAIDDKRSTDPADVKTAKNYVAAALADAMAGRPVGTGQTPAYGCSIKYAG